MYFVFGELGVAVHGPSDMGGVADIHEVGEGVVLGVAILVVDTEAYGTGTFKGLHYELVDLQEAAIPADSGVVPAFAFALLVGGGFPDGAIGANKET